MDNNFKPRSYKHPSDIDDVYNKLEKLRLNNKSFTGINFTGINFNAPPLIPRAHPTNEAPKRIYLPDTDNEKNPNPIPDKFY
jgi:hypothetical protein